MQRHEMSDEEWQKIEDLLPRSEGPGRPWEDHRRVLNAMFWVLRTGVPWRDLPERYGPWQTVYDRFNRWRKDGTWDRMLERLQIRLDENGQIDWDLWCIDGSSVRAQRSAAGARKKGALPMSLRTTRWAIREADGDRSSTFLLTAKELRS